MGLQVLKKNPALHVVTSPEDVSNFDDIEDEEESSNMSGVLNNEEVSDAEEIPGHEEASDVSGIQDSEENSIFEEDLFLVWFQSPGMLKFTTKFQILKNTQITFLKKMKLPMCFQSLKIVLHFQYNFRPSARPCCQS